MWLRHLEGFILGWTFVRCTETVSYSFHGPSVGLGCLIRCCGLDDRIGLKQQSLWMLGDLGDMEVERSCGITLLHEPVDLRL